MEMFTGKRLADKMFKDGLDLHNYVKKALSSRQTSVVLDPLFVHGEGEEEETK